MTEPESTQKPNAAEPATTQPDSKSSRWLEWATFGAAIIAAISAITAGYIASNSTHSEGQITRRSDAYAAYLGDMTKQNEFLWGSVAWAGVGATTPQPDDLTTFWATASQLQSSLESDYLKASMVTTDSNLQTKLDDLRISQQKIWLEYKCMSAVQTDCPKGADYTLASHTKIGTALNDWTMKTERTKAAIVSLARDDLK